MDNLQRAIDLYWRGLPREAELALEQQLAMAGPDAAALSLLAEIHSAAGRHERALTLLGQLVAREPHDAAVRRRLAAALLALGRPAESVQTLLQAIALDPANARARNNLGQAYMQLGRREEAMASYRAALRLDPGYAYAHNNLGLAHSAAGEWDQALDCFRRALHLAPTLAIAEVNAAIVFDQLGRSAEALQSYDRALAAAPNLVEAWGGRGAALAKLQQFASAIECFEKALMLRPGDAAMLTQQALVLSALERNAEALAAADAALAVDANMAQAHNARAAALRRLKRRSEALVALDRAIALDPPYVEAWCNRGTVLHELGRVDEAIAACRKALELNPQDLQARTRLLARLLPPVPDSSAETATARATFERELGHLESWLDAQVLTEADALTVAQQQFFYLSYQEQSNRAVLQRYRGACAARLAGLQTLPAYSTTTSHRAPRRFKLGFVSAFVHDHSVFNAILRGWLQALDRERFEISIFSLGTRQDALTQEARASVDGFEAGVRAPQDWARAIHDAGLDAVVYPEIGMHETTLALASLRLAPRQYAAWGHPETSGLPTIDGYLSADLFEPPQAQDHYSEPLLRLPNLGVYCQPYGVPSANLDLTALGIDRSGPVLICPGVPFKYRPQDDAILVEIARSLGRCNLVFFDHEIPELSRKLERRMASAFASGGLNPAHHLRWIPWQPRAAFFALLRSADVYLDTLGFSGFNTVMQAMECHLPCVTHEGRFMRGRFGSAVLKRLGMARCVAHDTRGYVELAVALAGDARHRAQIRDEIRRAEPRLYADASAIEALSNLLLDSRGDSLP
jgi:predicted O-linked N-acetylglucosamine transferase (SPINDLY family)